MRDSVVFYRSFYEAIKELPAEELAKSFKAIMEYGLNEIEPDGSGIEKTIYLLTKPQIDANNKRWKNGNQGGRPKNQPETKHKPSDNQTITKSEPKVKEKEKVKENDKERVVRFAPPSLDDVNAYCREKGYVLDAERFIDFYASKGWVVGKTKMKDWKAAVRNWARSQRQESTAKTAKSPNRFHNFDQRETNYDALVQQDMMSWLHEEEKNE